MNNENSVYTILQTKLYKPSISEGMVQRNHLPEKLTKGLQSKLILISAPAGFGKSLR